MSSPPSHPQSIFRRIFLSPDEARLRSGWRLLLHFMLLGICLLVFSLPVAVLMPNRSANPSFPDDALVVLAEVLTLAAFALATWIARRWLDHRSMRSLGFQAGPHLLPDLLVGIAIPGLLMAAIYTFESATGWLQFEAWGWQTAPASAILRGLVAYLLVFTMTAFGEELISRGYQLQNLVDGVGLPSALFLSAVLFAALHSANPGADAASFVGLLAAGYFLAYAWVRTGRLWLAIGLHLGWNFFEGVIFGFPVSGLNVFHLIHQHVDGPSLITGGDFGPEAGIVILPALAFGAWLIRLYTASRRPEVDRTRQTQAHEARL
jgi:membrane protease YdiL (CAAX protease family)